MKANGAQIIHLATGPDCRVSTMPLHITYFHDYIQTKYGLEVVYGTHPIPEKYLKTHEKLGTWNSDEWHKIIMPTMTDEKSRIAYN